MESVKANTRTAKEYVEDCLQAGLVPFLKSSPGTGKSSIIKGIAQEYGLKVIDHRLSTSTPEDMTGLPEFYTDEDGIRRAGFKPFDIFPVQGQSVPAGYDGWMLFLDEFNSGLRSVQAAAYKLVLDRMTGQYPLHERVMIVAAGNLDTDRAITNSLSTAMQSRLVHIEMQVVFNHWLEDVAIKQNYDHRVISYLSANPANLMDFRPDHNNATFCCPRTWGFFEALVHGKDFGFQIDPATNAKTYDIDRKLPLYAGVITEGVAFDFGQFTKVYENMPKLADILKQPLVVDVPADRLTAYAVIGSLLQNVTEKTFEPIATYVARFGTEFQVLFYRTCLQRVPELREHPLFAPTVIKLKKYL